MPVYSYSRSESSPEEIAGLLQMTVGESHFRYHQTTDVDSRESLAQFESCPESFLHHPEVVSLSNFIDANVKAVKGATSNGVSLALARIVVVVSRKLHHLYCDHRSSSQSCSIDVHAITGLFPLIVAPFCGFQLDGRLPQKVDRLLCASDLPEEQVVSEIAMTLATLLHPLWHRREPLRVVADRPIVQINSAISQIDAEGYESLRTLACRMGFAIERSGSYLCEVTSDYVTPSERDQQQQVEGFKEPGWVDEEWIREDLVRASIYRASAVISLTKNGRFGTAITWTLAEELLAPVLVLSHRDEQFSVARYPGKIGGRSHRVYDDDQHAVDIACEFISNNSDRIAARSQRIASYVNMEIGLAQQRFQESGGAAFAQSLVTAERARFLLSDPVHWFQGSGPARAEIKRVLGVSEGFCPECGSGRSPE